MEFQQIQLGNYVSSKDISIRTIPYEVPAGDGPIVVDMPIIQIDFGGKIICVDTMGDGINEIQEILDNRKANIQKFAALTGMKADDFFEPTIYKAFLEIASENDYDISGAAIAGIKRKKLCGGVILNNSSLLEMRLHDSINIALRSDSPVYIDSSLLEKIDALKKEAEKKRAKNKIPLDIYA